MRSLRRSWRLFCEQGDNVNKKISITLAVVLGAVVGFMAPTWAARVGGTYSLPNTATVRNPVTAGQVITKELWNGNFQDLAQALTDSLDRSSGGAGDMARALYGIDGSAGAVSVGFTSSHNTGMYAPAAGQVGLSASGVSAFTSTSTATTVPLPVSFTSNATFNSNVILVNTGISTSLRGPASGGNYLLTLPTAVPTAATVGATAWASGNVILYDMVTADTGKVYVCTKSGTTTVAPSGTGMAQAPGGVATWDYYAPDVSAPVVMSPTGSLSASRLSNSHQNFGAPVEQRDVVIKSYYEDHLAWPRTLSTVCLAANSATATSGGALVWTDSGLTVTLAANTKYLIQVTGSVNKTADAFGDGTMYVRGQFTGTTALNPLAEYRSELIVTNASPTGNFAYATGSLGTHALSMEGQFRVSGTGGDYKVQIGAQGATSTTTTLMESGTCLTALKIQ
jgi:hypothetical protein